MADGMSTLSDATRIMTNQRNDTIIWKRLNLPGHDFAQVVSTSDGHTLSGTAVFVSDGENFCLDYSVCCNPSWETKTVLVSGVANGKPVEIEIVVTPDKHWLRNGVEQPKVQGCIDVDLEFTPATNLLPLRRENLDIGESCEAVAAWLRFPELTMELLPQTYRRISGSLYRYSSGEFSADLTARESGLVTHYSGLWKEERVP
jgi:hypothetical protein